MFRAFYLLILLVLLTAATTLRADAACLVRPNGLVTCDVPTATSNSTNVNGARASSDDREQNFDNGSPIDASVGNGVAIFGKGLDLSQAGGRNHPARTIRLTNDGAISASGVSESLGFHGNGATIAYIGAGTVASSDGTAIFVRNEGDVSLTLDGNITGGVPPAPKAHQKEATPPAVKVIGIGVGGIVVGGAGNVVGQGGRGIWAEQTTGLGGVLVTGTGDTAGRGVICPGVTNLQYALSKGKTGCSGIRAVIDSHQNDSNILVNRSGNVSGTSTAINAITMGRGNIDVATGATAQITGVSEFGIEAAAKGANSSGSIRITTGAGGTVTSGGNGIFAVNNASHIDRARNSSISIDANGTINSGSFALAATNNKNPTGVLGGISAGFVGGDKATFNEDVYGSLFIDDKAAITAAGGDGVVAYNFGRGPISVHVQNTVTSRSGNGISTTAGTGSTTIAITGATITASGIGHAAVIARSTTGEIGVNIDPGSVLRGQDGSFGVDLNGSRSTIANRGFVQGGSFSSRTHGPPLRGTGITGSNITLVNEGIVVGGVDTATSKEAYAIAFTGGQNYVANTGRIDSIDVAGTASLAPALPNSKVGTSLAVQGDLRFAPTAHDTIRLNARAADSIDATGGAKLGSANLNIVTDGHAPAAGRSFTIISASQGISSHFGSVTTDLAFLQPAVFNDGRHVTITARYDFRLAQAPTNASALGTALDRAMSYETQATKSFFDSLERVPTAQGFATLDALSGEGLTAPLNVALRAHQLFDSAIFDQMTADGPDRSGHSITLTDATPGLLAEAPAVKIQRQPLEGTDPSLFAEEPLVPRLAPQRTWRAWATGAGGAESLKGSAAVGTSSQYASLYAGVLGVDYQVLPDDFLGIALGGSNASSFAPGCTTAGATTGGHVAVYDVAAIGSFYAASAASFSNFSNQTNRSVAGFGGLMSENESGRFASREFGSRLEVGHPFDGDGAKITPFVSMEIAALRSSGFIERATSGPGVFALNVSGQNTTSLPGHVGARLQRAVSLEEGVILRPSVEAAYVHEFSPGRWLNAALVNVPGSAFVVEGARPARDVAEVKAGGDLSIGSDSHIFATLDGAFSHASQYHGGRGGFLYLW